MGSEGAPLLPPAPAVEGCPGCAMERRKASLKGRIPYRELFFVGITSLASSLPITCLFPFLYFMVRDFHIAKTEEDIGFYAGFLAASYMVGRAFAAIFLGIVSDRIGRKPVISFSILSVVIFNTLFGLSTTYWMAITTRFVLGTLNGLLAPIKVNTAWALGLIVGPALGGFLAQPTEKYAHIFSEDSVFSRFPYLLPCLSVSSFATAVLVICRWLPILSLWAVTNRKYGGLSFSTEDIGEVLAIAGASLLVYQLIIYRWVHKILGTVNSSRIASALSILVLATYPFMTYLSGARLSIALCSAAMMKSALAITATTGICLLQNNSVCQEQRGTANSISTTAGSFFKAVAPVGAGALFSWAQKRQDAAFLPGDQVVFVMLNLVELLGLISTFEPSLILPALQE